eukprot:scaffold298820_cov12-Tisochrysis_lutea.AAC.1
MRQGGHAASPVAMALQLENNSAPQAWAWARCFLLCLPALRTSPLSFASGCCTQRSKRHLVKFG